MAKRKTFVEENPALRFITNPEAETRINETTEPNKAPAGYKLNPLYIEAKSKRVQLLFKPSLYKAVKEQADLAGLSVNEYIHQTLETKIKGE